MKAQEFRKLIREEVRKVLKEAKLNPTAKLYWYEYYPHYMAGDLKAEAVLTGKDLMDLKAAYESDQDDVFDKLLKKVTKKGTFYFAYDVFTDHWSKLTKKIGRAHV